MRLKARPRAFALLELVIVLVLMALMLTLLVPALGAAGDAARHDSSRNKLRIIGLGSVYHLETHKIFPPLYFINKDVLSQKLNARDTREMYPWQVHLLDYLDEKTLSRNISTASEKFSIASDKVQVPNPEDEKKLVSPSTISLSCFQFPQAAAQPSVHCNYAAIPATRLPLLVQTTETRGIPQRWKTRGPEGVIIPDNSGHGRKSKHITDGTSNTVMFCESRETERSNWYNSQQGFVCGFLPGDSQPIDEQQTQFYPCFKRTNSGREWTFNPQTGDRTALEFGPSAGDSKRAYYNEPDEVLARTWGPSGGYSTGVTQHCFADGSLRDFAADLDPKVYFAVITVNGGEVGEAAQAAKDPPIAQPKMPMPLSDQLITPQPLPKKPTPAELP